MALDVLENAELPRESQAGGRGGQAGVRIGRDSFSDGRDLSPWPRSMMNPDSFPELSCQKRLIWLEETADAERLEGGAGGSLPPPPLAAAHALGVIRRVTKPSA